MPQPTSKSYLAGLLLLTCTAVVGLLLDLWTKHLSVAHFAPWDDIYRFIPGYIHFTAVANHGAVFGLGQGWRWLFVAVSVAAVGFVVYMFHNSPRRWWHDLALGMLLAGILGNLYDRIFIGYVRDMIHVFPRWPNLFPWVFNIADSLLCVSIGILLIAGILTPQPKGKYEPTVKQP